MQEEVRESGKFLQYRTFFEILCYRIQIAIKGGDFVWNWILSKMKRKE